MPPEQPSAADLALRKGNLSIAVEITITTTIDHEFGNVKKCLAAGFGLVAVVSPKPERLAAIAEAVQAGLDAEAASKVVYCTPDGFIAELRRRAQAMQPCEPPGAPDERTTQGYRVRRRGPALTPAERKAKEDIAIQILAEAMKKKTG